MSSNSGSSTSILSVATASASGFFGWKNQHARGSEPSSLSTALTDARQTPGVVHSRPMPIPHQKSQQLQQRGSPSSILTSGSASSQVGSSEPPSRHYFDNPRFLPHF